MKTKNISMVAVGTILAAVVVVSYLMARPALFVRESSLPVFMGEEVIIQKSTDKTVKALKGRTAVKAEKAVTAVKAEGIPVPKVAAPLPILPPRVSYRVLPEYPVSALEQGLQGTAVLSIYVGLSGAAEKVEVRSSSGAAELDASALAAVSQWTFDPASQGGAAVASWFELPVRFEIK